jgi:hypothetical protein
MRAPRKTRAVGLLIVAVMLVVTCLAPGAQKEKTPDEQRAAEIRERIEKANAAWSSQPEQTWPPYDEMVGQVLDTLPEEEIRIAAQHLHFIGVEKEAFRRWARFDPVEALKAVRAFEDANAAEIQLAGTGFEGGPGEAMQEYVFSLYLGAIDGWSEVAPKTAWESFKSREGPLSNSRVVEDYLSYFYLILFEHLAKADPDLAFQELVSFCADDCDELFIAHMLAGYLHGVPRGRDWPTEVTRLLERKWDGDWLYAEIRTAFMGRWLQDSPAAAEKWFREGDVQDLHWFYSEIDPFASTPAQSDQENDAKEKKRHHLGSAAGYWAARDFPPAWQWMKASSGFHREGFAESVLHGADVCLQHRTSYSLRGEEARDYVLEQAARLPDQADRTELASRFARVLWVFDDTEFLGQPPPDKGKWLADVRSSLSALRLSPETTSAILQKLQIKGKSDDGDGQSVTAPESEFEVKEKPKTDSTVRPN